MEIEALLVDCQQPDCSSYISRTFNIARCKIVKCSPEYIKLLDRAKLLSGQVNQHAANDVSVVRDQDRRVMDVFGGVLAEQGWIQYINSNFGEIAFSELSTSSRNQIDIKLLNGELLEVRSSFPRKGVKFAICNKMFNFKNLGPYSSSIKPREIQKHLYLGVLFDTQKTNLLLDKDVQFSLIGGSTWQMMVEKGYDEDLVPEGEYSRNRSRYKVIKFENVLDAMQVVKAIVDLGYKKR